MASRRKSSRSAARAQIEGLAIGNVVRPRKPTGSASPRRKRVAILITSLIVVAAGLGFIIHGLLRVSDRRSPDQTATRPQPAVTAPEAEAEAKFFERFAGSASCRECHQDAYEKWQKSHHASAERPVDLARDRVAFDPPRSFRHGSQTTDLRLEDGKLEVAALGLSGKKETHVVSRVIGVDPLLQYLVPAPAGRLQTLEASYDPHKNEWFNVFGSEDRKPGEWGHWTGRGMNWNNMCAVCHNTGLRKNYHAAQDIYDTKMVELGVGCESCHGPMKDHVQWQVAKGEGGRRKDESEKGSGFRVQGSEKTTGNSVAGLGTQDSGLRTRTSDPTLKKVTRRQMFDVCGGCHSRRAELTAEFGPREQYHDHHWLTIPDNSDIFYPDGQIRDEDYEFTSFLSSRMYAGGVRCVDCHEPHASKPALQGNALCMKCHGGSYPNAPVIDPAAHSFHKPDSAGSLCINCHMPQTVYMQRHWRHDHGFTIPDPLLTKQHNIPNACNRCHNDKDTDWSLAAVEKWYGPRMERPTRWRAQVFAKAKHGQADAREGLLKILKEERITFWRAVAANLLGNYLSALDVLPALAEAGAHPDPLVRENVARALEPLAGAQGSAGRLALEKFLADPRRNVRVRAAWALRDSLDSQSPASKDLLAFLHHNQDQPGGAMQLGMLLLARNDLSGAVEQFKRAVAWDGGSAPFRDALAVGLSMQGRPAEAVQQLEAAVKLDPREAEYRYKLALAYHELGQLDKTTASLEAAVKLNPRHGRAWYNLGLAYNAKGLIDPAIAALKQGESAAPGDAQIPYALATILARKGDREGAKEAARRALRINPGYVEAQQLLGALER